MGKAPHFLGTSNASTTDVVIFGAPLDLTESFKSGTAEAPARIREVSQALETYSPVLDRDLTEILLADWGDVSCGRSDVETALGRIEVVAARAIDQGLPLMIGGEHTATIGALRGVRQKHHQLFVAQIDAHLDLRDQYDGLTLSHATVLHRIADEIGLNHCLQFGVRSGTREEFALARRCLASGPTLALAPEIRQILADAPIYLTIDIDVLDPGSAPGTGCPEPGGPSFAELLGFLYALSDLNVVAADVMEVLPASDVNDVTSIAAAKLLRELALLFAKPHPMTH